MGKVQDHKRAAKAKKQAEQTEQETQTSQPDQVEIEGVVEKCLPNTMFRVKVTTSPAKALVGKTLLGTLAGKMRLYRIRVMPGDEIKGYVSKYDLGKCKITYRSIKKRSQ